MPLPQVNYCIVCEALRSEERNKATLLGFYNLLPWVQIRIGELGVEGIVPLLFVFGTSGGTGKANFQLTILNPDGTEFIKTPETTVSFREGFDLMNVGMGVPMPAFAVAGDYLCRLRVSGKQAYESSFTVILDPSVS